MTDPFVEDLLEYVNSPIYGPILKKLVEHEDKVLAEGGWHKDGTWDGRPMGWEWYEVQVAPGHLNKLAYAGIVGIVAKSNKHTDYRLTDVDVTRKALAGELTPQAEAAEDVDPDDVFMDVVQAHLFEPIIGYEDVKDLFLRALTSKRPVHVALEGPPASAKTLFLMEIGRLPRATFAVGGSASKAGLTDLLLMYRPRYLILDEVETIDNARDYSVLLHLMENQEVIETKYRRHERVSLSSWVFAAGNDVSKLPPALLSRFGGPKSVIRFKEYSYREFTDITVKLLTTREGATEDFARKVAEASLDLGSRDVRTAVRLTRLAQDDKGLEQVVETMRRRR